MFTICFQYIYSRKKKIRSRRYYTMNTKTYHLLEDYMRACMHDSAHDKEHIYRVLYAALEIGKTEPDVNWDVLIAACLLHDIGRSDQFADPKVCHAEAGSKKAFRFLTEHGFDTDFASHVCDCILTHRFRKNAPPQTLEAKILFDADKLDVTGTIGIARTLLYNGTMSEPLYTMRPDGTISDGSGYNAPPSFFQEYKRKLEKLYDRFYTQKANEMALSRRQAAIDFYTTLYWDVSNSYTNGSSDLEQLLDL